MRAEPAGIGAQVKVILRVDLPVKLSTFIPISRCKENTRYYEGECVHAPGHNILSAKMPGAGSHGSQPSVGFDEVH